MLQGSQTAAGGGDTQYLLFYQCIFVESNKNVTDSQLTLYGDRHFKRQKIRKWQKFRTIQHCFVGHLQYNLKKNIKMFELRYFYSEQHSTMNLHSVV